MPGLLQSQELFRLIVEEAKEFAIFLVDVDGKVASWNSGAARIFGYAEPEIVGKNFSILFTARDRELGVPEKELAVARATGRAADTRWHLRNDGRTFFADGVTTCLQNEAGELVGFSKISRDITDRYLTEKRLAAQLALTNLLTTEQPFHIAAQRMMQTICENLGWDIGALWQVNDKDATLQPIDAWIEPTLDAAAVRTLTSGPTLPRGIGLPGRVWETRQPIWVTGIPEEADFPRAKAAHAVGMSAAFAFPIVFNAKVLGVMEFFSREHREPDQALLPVMAIIGAQIGEYIERRNTSEALRLSEKRYRVITETAQDAIFTIDEESRILFVNPAVEQMFGYAPHDIIGKMLDVIIPERLRAAHRNGIRRYLATHERHIPWKGVELPAVHRDGHEFPVELSFGAWTDDGRTVFSGFARDITERRKTAAELETALAHEQQARSDTEAARAQLERRADEEESFRRLASALTGAVEMADVLAEITARATVVTRADGVYVESIVGSDGLVEIISSSGRGAPARGTRVAFPGSLTEEMIVNRRTVILADMDGFGASMAPYLMKTCSNCQVLVSPLVADDEPLGALVLLNSGQSGRRFGDADIIRAKTLGDLTSLALRRVRLMEKEREAREKAEAAVRVRDETLGIVSHDLRNPLTTVALSADLLVDAPAAEQREHIETIRGAARQMQRLIQDLLDVARVEAGGLSVQCRLIDPAETARQACDAQQPIAEAKGLLLVCDVPTSLPQVNADRDRVIQVLGNLLGNAMKFTPPGGTVTVEANARGKLIEFRVRDTGPGIPESDLKNVFRPYWQAKKTAHMGAGLGLAIVRGIVEAHGGTVSAANAPGGGAMFTFTIPIAANAAAASRS